jgi:3',5'-cyclic-AMP phosphodiesterase
VTLNILQLTDFHVFADSKKKFFGIPTYDTLKDILNEIKNLDIKFDYLIITGDLTSDETIESYENVKNILGKRILNCKIIPGNHDDRNLIRKIFPDCVENNEGPINFSISTDSWQLFGIDTHVPGQLYGNISNETIEWLRNLLEQNKTKPTMIFQHHPPIHIQTKWVDALGLKKSDDYLKLLKQHPQIRVVSCGHVHQEFSGNLENISVLTSPSTGLQFKKGTDMLECDPLPPGFRIFSLSYDSWNSQIIRLDKLKYNPVNN